LPPGAVDSDTLGDRAVKLAELAGLNLDPWQQRVLRGMLRRDRSGIFSAYEVCLNVPRQNGKSLLLEAYDLALLFLAPAGTLILHTAHQFKTALESFRHLLGLVRNCPDLFAEVAPNGIRTSHGEEKIELKNGSRLHFQARTVSGAGRGFSPDVVVLDEAYRLPAEALAALQPALSARPNPQMVYASSTGYPDSEILWALVQRGRAGGDESLAYFEWSADPGLEKDDPRAWAQANPALSYRLTEKKIGAEWRSMKDRRAEDFARERLGWWAEAGLDGIFPAGMWAELADGQSTVQGPLSFGLEVAQDRSWSSIGVAGRRPDGLLHVQVAENHPGTDWVAAKLVDLGAVEVALRPNSAAGALVGDIERAGLRVEKVPQQQYAGACGRFYDLVRDRQLRHLVQGELEHSVENATKKDSGDAFVFEGMNGSDISPLTANVLAAHVASLERASVYEERGVRFL
jgi:phage terminase large subunit-like protein